jgi:hypothetical protein
VNSVIPRARGKGENRSNHYSEAAVSCSVPETTRKKTAGRDKYSRKVRSERYAVMLDNPGVGRCYSVPRMSYSRPLTQAYGHSMESSVGLSI